MRKIFFLSVLLSFRMIPSFAQKGVNADKNDITDSKTNTVSITAVAIPGGMPLDMDTSAANYHRIVITGSESAERGLVPSVVEITVSAKAHDQSSESDVKKEAVPASPQKSLPADKVMPKKVEIIAPAVKHE